MKKIKYNIGDKVKCYDVPVGRWSKDIGKKSEITKIIRSKFGNDRVYIGDCWYYLNDTKTGVYLFSDYFLSKREIRKRKLDKITGNKNWRNRWKQKLI